MIRLFHVPWINVKNRFCPALVNSLGKEGVPQQRLHDRRGSWPRLHSEQKDPQRTVGTVQLHPGSVTACLHSSLGCFVLFLLSTDFLFVVFTLHFCLKSGGREREEQQHCKRTHPRQQSPWRAKCGGVHRASQTAEGFQEQKRRGRILSSLKCLFSAGPQLNLDAACLRSIFEEEHK